MHDAAWEADGVGGTDRALALRGVTQAFDGSETEQASLERPIDETNRGFILLSKMGWSRGRGLGRSGDGITEPVRLGDQYGTLGLGKATEYEEHANAATETRRAMTSEIIAAEDDAARCETGSEPSCLPVRSLMNVRMFDE